MLDLTRCRLFRDRESHVATGVNINAEGLALITLLENGVEVVKPATGTGTDKFVGFSYGEKFTSLTMSIVAKATIPSTGTYVVTLPKNNIVPDNIFVYDNTGGNAMTEHATTPADDVFVCNDSTGVLTFHSADAGHDLTITFRYYPTVLEVQNDTDQFFYKPSGSDFLSQIGVILEGEVYTDQFDASVDWASATSVKTEAGGLLTDHTGSGTVVPATIINIPNTSNSFLGLRF